MKRTVNSELTHFPRAKARGLFFLRSRISCPASSTPFRRIYPRTMPTPPSNTPANPVTPADRSWLNWLLPLSAGLAHAVLMLLAHPPVGLAWLAPIAWAPIFLWFLSNRSDSIAPTRAAWLIAIGVSPYWIVTQWWVSKVSGFGYVPLVIVLCLQMWLVCRVAAGLRSRLPRAAWLFMLPLVAAGMDYFRGEVFFDGYAWGFAGHPLIDVPVLASPGVVGGFYLVNFLAIMAAAAIAVVLSACLGGERTKRRLGESAVAVVAVLALWAGLAGWGTALQRSAADGPGFPVAMLQTNVPQDNKIDWTPDDQLAAWRRMEKLCAESFPGIELDPEAGERATPVAQVRPELMLWPETMMPGMTLEPKSLQTLADNGIVYHLKKPLTGIKDLGATAFADRLLEDLQPNLGVPMLIGEVALEGLTITPVDDGLSIEHESKFNSVYLIDKERIQPIRYDKIRLTSFGETMPYISKWKWLEEQMLGVAAKGMAFDLKAGTKVVAFEIPSKTVGRSVRIVTPICFEMTDWAVCRKLTYVEGTGERRADLIANVTNDGWFSESKIAHVQHLQVTRWRALELGTPLIRAANTGISAIVDETGKVLKSGVDAEPGAIGRDGVLTGVVPLRKINTPFGSWGDVAGRATCVVALLATVWVSFAGIQNRRRSNRKASKA